MDAQLIMKKQLTILLLFLVFTAKGLTVQEFINAQALIDSPLTRKTPPDDAEQQSLSLLKNLINARVSGIVEGVSAANQMYEVRTGKKILCLKDIDTDALIKELAVIWDNTSKANRISISDANLSTFVTMYLENKYKCI